MAVFDGEMMIFFLPIELTLAMTCSRPEDGERANNSEPTERIRVSLIQHKACALPHHCTTRREKGDCSAMTVEDVKDMLNKLSANREAMFSVDTMEEHMKSLRNLSPSESAAGVADVQSDRSFSGAANVSIEQLHSVGHHELSGLLEQHQLPSVRESLRESKRQRIHETDGFREYPPS
jgi:hypothetical protein